MKSKLRTAAAAVVIFSLLTGCAGRNEAGISSGMANSSLFSDMQKGVAVEGSEVMEEFNKALENSDASSSATIDTQVSIELTEGEETINSKSTTRIMFQPDADKSQEADAAEETETAEDASSEAEDGEYAEDVSEPMLAYVNVNNEYNGETNTMEGFYRDGYLYYTLEDNKVKESMSYESLMSVVGSYAVQFDADVVDSAYKVESKKETQYTVKFEPVAMASMMMDNMAGAGSPMGEDETMVVNEAYLYFVVDGNGCLSGFDMELDAKFASVPSNSSDGDDTEDATAEAGTMGSSESAGSESPFKYSVVANFSDLDSTEVTPFEELDSYEDVNTVLERLQAEAETANTEEGEASETETEAEDENPETAAEE